MDLYSALNLIEVKKCRLMMNSFSDEVREQIDSEEENNQYSLVKNISSLGYKIIDDGIEFYPFMVMDGKRTFAIEDISEADYQVLKKIEINKVPVNIRARIADILWTQKKDYPSAIVAAESYYELYQILFCEDDWVGVLDYIKRAIYISAQIKKKDIYGACCNEVFCQLLSIKGEDEHFLSIKLIEILLKENFGDKEKIIAIIENIIRLFQTDVNKIENAYELKIKYLSKMNDQKAVKRTYIEFAEYLLKFAEGIMENNMLRAMQAERYFQKAINIFRNCKEMERANQTIRRLIDIQKEIPKNMAPITTEIDLSDIHSNIDKNMEDLSFEESIIRLTQMIVFYKREDVKKQVFEEIDKYPLSHMFGKTVVNRDGQTVLTLNSLDWHEPEKNQELLDKHIFQKMFEMQRYSGDFVLGYCMYLIRNNYDFSVASFDFLVKDNAIIPAGRERIFASAIYMALQGQCYEALHILAPQAEYVFRSVAKESGGITITLEDDGTSKEKVLSSILDLPELLDCYDNDILFLFKGLLNDQAGANIRNNIAHGILEYREGNSGASLYFIVAVIKLLSYTSPRCYEIVKNSDRLHQFEQLEEDTIIIRNKAEEI